MVKVEFKDWSFLSKRAHPFKNFIYPGSLDLHQQIGDTIFNERSKDSRQVWFFLVNALYFFIKL